MISIITESFVALDIYDENYYVNFTICRCCSCCYFCTEGLKAMREFLGALGRCIAGPNGHCCSDAAGASSSSPVVDMDHRYDTVTISSRTTENIEMTEL